ncbi:FIST signal transduction protein [Balneola vulgaris]|uniref:FIST signal transduction protein n=1 Tax=Balneola vulgaris TaxID=287535 RepID=UPI000368BBA3|nr:FIST N-terminal domain-containing protein [Balneola vulgaris]
MKSEQLIYSNSDGWVSRKRELGFSESSATLVFMFGTVELLGDESHYNFVRSKYPNAKIVTASTSGEISDQVHDEQNILVTAIQLEKTPIEVQSLNHSEVQDSYELGAKLAKKLSDHDLNHILVVSDGQVVNGSELVKGIRSETSNSVSITGGMASDNAQFIKTLVSVDEIPSEGNVVLIGFYGENIKITYGAKGGWDEFGPHRIVTKSIGNVLYEIDGKNALEIYKRYLGDKAEELPGSALLFPLNMKLDGVDEPLVRTVLNVDDEEGTMTFAGNMIEGSTVRFMRANFDRIIEGAMDAAVQNVERFNLAKNPDLVLMVSCVGRKLVLNQRIEEEVESVVDVFGQESTYAGFFSNGEISPHSNNLTCELHNQTMTITTFTELE